MLLTWAPALPFLPCPKGVNSRRNPHRATNFFPSNLSCSLFLSLSLFHLMATFGRGSLHIHLGISVCHFYSSNAKSRTIWSGWDPVLFLHPCQRPDFPSLSSPPSLLFLFLHLVWQNCNDKQALNCRKSISLCWLCHLPSAGQRRAACRRAAEQLLCKRTTENTHTHRYADGYRDILKKDTNDKN